MLETELRRDSAVTCALGTELEEQRPTECGMHITADDYQFGHAEVVFGQAWRQSWHGESAARTCRQMRSKADSANRSNLHDSTAQCGPTVAQSSNLSRGLPQ